MEWIDSHTHLDYEYPISIEEYLANAKRQNITQFITIGTELKTFEPIRQLADTHESIYFTVGVHPHEAKDFNDITLKKMEELHSHQKCVAIGEIGLDYHYDHSPRDIQQVVLKKQLDLALQWKLPVVIHSRDAEEDLLKQLTEYANNTKQDPGVIHCFSGTTEFAKACLKLGFYISFSGILTFKKAEEIRDVAKLVPQDRILLETDSPYLAPIPYRGKSNQSAYMIETAKILAQTIGVELQTLSTVTVANTKRLFNLP